MREQGTASSFVIEDVVAAEAHDERTLEVRLGSPRSYFPYVLAGPWSFPWPRHRARGARRRLAKAGEPRRQRAVHHRGAQRGAPAARREPFLDGHARKSQGDPHCLLDGSECSPRPVAERTLRRPRGRARTRAKHPVEHRARFLSRDRLRDALTRRVPPFDDASCAGHSPRPRRWSETAQHGVTSWTARVRERAIRRRLPGTLAPCRARARRRARAGSCSSSPAGYPGGKGLPRDRDCPSSLGGLGGAY